MKQLVLLFLLAIFMTCIEIQSVWAPTSEPTFVGNSQFQNLPVLYPGETANFTIKLWLDGPQIYEIKPVIDVYPTSTSSHVKIEAESLSHLEPNTAGTFHVVITTDSKVPLGKIFLSAYFTAKDNYGIPLKGGWSDHGSTINVEPSHQNLDSLASQLEQARQNIQPAKKVSDLNSSPLKQFKSGISAENVKCKENLTLVIKKNGQIPACVKYETSIKLVSRGWAFDSLLIGTSGEETVPGDFRVSTTVNGFTTLDSQKNFYHPDMCSPPIEFPLNLSKQDKQQIWDLTLQNNFFELDDFVPKCGDLENCVRSLPEIIITLNMTGNGKTHSVTHHNSYIKNENDSLDKFENIMEALNKMLSQRDKANNFSGPRCGLL